MGKSGKQVWLSPKREITPDWEECQRSHANPNPSTKSGNICEELKKDKERKRGPNLTGGK